MKGYIIKEYNLIIASSELKEIHDRMLSAFQNNEKFEEIIYDGEFKIKFIMSEYETALTHTEKNGDNIDFVITLNEVAELLKNVKRILKNTDVGGSLEVAKYCVCDDAVVKIIAQQWVKY